MVDTVIIIGAGAAGIGAAIALADKGFRVKLIEKHTLGSGASGRNPGRMGHGFHYTDEETAFAYLHASIKVQRKYPGFLLDERIPNSPLRKGRYFITKDSNPGKEVILACYKKIQEEYARLVAEDSENAVFGPPENFYRIMTPSEYESDVNMDIVDVGIETNEHIFRWSDFSAHIREVIQNHPNIELIEDTSVELISRNTTGRERFTLDLVKDNGEKTRLSTNYIVNSTWENIERLNAQIGIKMVEGLRTNRLKTLLIVKLPPELLNVNSMFFCMGQHGMMSNIGNGYAMMTFAKVTNIETASGLNLSENAQRLLNGGATPEEVQHYGKQILDGVSYYIPAMKNAQIVDVKFGVVQTPGKLTLKDLTDPSHEFNKRAEHCVRAEEIGLISNPCMKLFYIIDNGEIVLDIVQLHVFITDIIDHVINIIRSKEFLRNSIRFEFTPQKERAFREEMEKTPVHTLLTQSKEQLADKYIQQLLMSKQSLTPKMGMFKSSAATSVPAATNSTIKPNQRG